MGRTRPWRSLEKSTRRIIAARAARRASIDRYCGAGRTLIVLSLAIPGSTKAPPGAGALFRWAVGEVRRAFPAARPVETRVDALGPFAIWRTRTWPDAAKARCVALESSQPAARLVDLDVYSPDGAPVDRAALLLLPRLCVCCDRPAHECFRRGSHASPEVAARTRELLAALDEYPGA